MADEHAREDVEATLVELLRRAGGPVREAALYERARSRHDGLSAALYLAALERLATLGHLHVAVEHDFRANDPEPFGPRFWRVVE
ncbi:hypothetical protein [Miltoncostaea marina]|uniref:hypothetical protein n=1 Tax=Miltoncostaea marina TaxID=2843215 RepID=UPI001C3E4929|nr:hypothetical protein [Miltoncostaea marina]